MFEAASVPHIFAYLYPGIFKQISLYTIAGYSVFLPMVLLGVLVAVVFTIINYIGAKPYGIAMTIMTFTFAIIGFSTFLLGIGCGVTTPEYMANMGENLWGELPPIAGLSLVLALAALFYVGFDMIPQAAEEYKYESRKLARLIVLSILVGTAWYLLVTLLDGFLLPREMIPLLDMPTADAVAGVWGVAGKYIIAYVGVFGILSTYIGSFYASIRVLFALARARLLPEWFARVHPKYGVPHITTLFVGILAIIAPLFGRRAIIWFADACSAYTALLYLLVCVAFISLRRKEPLADRPYKAPLGIAGAIIGVITCIAIFISVIVPGMPAALVWSEEYAIFVVFLVLGILFYFLTPYVKKKVTAEEVAYLILGEYMPKRA